MLFSHATTIGMENQPAAHAGHGPAPAGRAPQGHRRGAGGGRRQRSRDWIFTWNNYREVEFQNLRDIGLNRPELFRYLVFGREVGASGTPHLQGFVQFHREVDLGVVQQFLCPGPRGNERSRTISCRIRRGTVEQASDYCKKDGDFSEFGEPSPGERARTDLREFVERIRLSGPLSMAEMMDEYPEIQARYPRWVEQVFDVFEPRQEVEEHPLRDWQTDMVAMLDGEPDRRRVVFVVDYTGNTGKSWFIDFYRSTHPDCLVLHPSKHENMAYVLSKCRPKPRVVFIDCPREKLDFFSYTFLEDLKNGRVLSSKYETKMVELKNPHVVVMMNSDPDRTKLSNDRFRVIVLDPMNQPIHYFPEE